MLLQNKIDLYNGATSVVNCYGLGTCGTCAVQVEGTISEIEWRERTRLSLPPHSLTQNRRLACQIQVLGDVKVTKFDRPWGQGDQTVWTPKA